MKKLFLLIAILAFAPIAAQAQVTFAGGVSGSVTVNCVPKATVANTIATTKICSDGTTTTINTDKVSITEASGNTVIAGTLGVTSTITGTSASASALVIGRLGATTPAFVVDASTALQASGLKITGAASGAGVAVAAIGGSAEALTINAKGTGTIGIGSVSTGAVTITPATTVTGALTTSGGIANTGTITSTGAINGPFGASVDTTTPVVLTAAQSGQVHVSNSTADAVQVFTLPVASVAGGRHCFALGSSSLGSNREIDVEPAGASDLIIGTTTPAGGTGIVTTAGPAHGIKNTHATAVRGNAVCLQSDGVNTWYMTSLSGVWASY